MKRKSPLRGVPRPRRSTPQRPRGAHRVCTCCGKQPVKKGNYFLCANCFANHNDRCNRYHRLALPSLIIVLLMFLGCASNRITTTDFDPVSGARTRETVYRLSDAGLALRTHQRLQSEYLQAPDGMRVVMATDSQGRTTGVKEVVYHSSKGQPNTRIPATAIEAAQAVAGNILNPLHWLGWAVVEGVKKRSSHTAINAQGDATYSAPEQHDTVHTSADPSGADRSTSTTDIYAPVEAAGP